MNKVYLWERNVPLYNEEITEQDKPHIFPYIKEGSKSLIVVCPGGGYRALAIEHEGHDIAEYLNSINVSALVLHYRVKPYNYPCAQFDAKRAIRYARFNAKKYGYDEDKIGILGFSAGGHLAASLATISDDFEYENHDEIDSVSGKPDFSVLCYPVISTVNYPHWGSKLNLLGGINLREAQKYSLELRVNENTCPAFIWHTASDTGVPVENSLSYAAALSRYQIPYELHVYKQGRHGVGLANGVGKADYIEDVKRWSGELAFWLSDIGCR